MKNKSYNFQKKVLENIIRTELNINYFDRKSPAEDYFLEKNKLLIDESFIFKLIKENKLLPFISENLFIKKHLRNLYFQVKNKAKIEFLKSIRLSLLTSEVSNFLREKGINHLIIKGIALSQIIYNDISKRGGGDLDILIKEDELIIVINLLEKLGFYPIKNNFPLLKDSLWFSYSKWVYYEVSLVRKRAGYYDFIDLHWRLNNNTSGIPSFEEVWSLKERFNLNNAPIYIPNLEHNLIIIASNAAKDKWIYYRNLIDFNLLIHKNKFINLDNNIKKKFFDMSLYSTYQLTKYKNLPFNKKFTLNQFFVNYINKVNFQLSQNKSTRKNKLFVRIFLFFYKIYLCENINDLAANICINIVTPKSIAENSSNGYKNPTYILVNRFKSFINLF